MNKQPTLNRKLKRVGLALTILSILGILSAFSAIAFLAITSIVAPIQTYPSPFLEPLMELPGQISPNTSIASLQAMEHEFFLANQPKILLNALFGMIIDISICVFVIRIGLAWRRYKSFSSTVTSGLRWIGIITVINSIYGTLTLLIVNPSFISEIFPLSFIYDSMMLSTTSNGLGGFTTGLLLIALSFALKQGKALKKEQELTV